MTSSVPLLPFKRILVTGSGGQLGSAFRDLLSGIRDCNVTFSDARCDLPGDIACDLADTAALTRLLDATQPQLILNPAAYTAVDRAETEESLAHAINATAPGIMAAWAASHSALMAHYSTDYVFDGSGEAPWREDDPTGPLSAYGRTKLAGEKAVMESGVAGAIFRTSWVYSATGQNFLKTMLRLGAEREELRVVADQVGIPTSADFLARMSLAGVATIAARVGDTSPDTAKCPVYHLVPRGETTWHAFATAIFDHARAAGQPLKVQRVLPITTSEYPTPARRPLNSRLDCSRFEKDFGTRLEDWRPGFDAVMRRLLSP